MGFPANSDLPRKSRTEAPRTVKERPLELTRACQEVTTWAGDENGYIQRDAKIKTKNYIQTKSAMTYR